MKILYVTRSQKRVREFKEILKRHVESIVTIDSLFDLDYDVLLTVPTRDLESNVKKMVNAVWKKEKENYDYIVGDAYGLFSDYAPNILGVDSDSWWPGTQREKSEALVNLFTGVKDRQIYYKAVYVAYDKQGKAIVSTGYNYGYLAKRVREKNGDFYDGVFITKDGKYLSSYEPEVIWQTSARYGALEQLATKIGS